MYRLALLLAMTLAPIFSIAQSSTSSSKFAVGSCEPKLTSFNTISQAVNAVPPASTILVCPGNYPEQVVITQPVTLQGVLVGGSGAAVITVPSGGLGLSLSPSSGVSVAALLAVENTGPVNIIDMGVDGSGGALGGGCAGGTVIGIYYLSSSGTLNHVAVRHTTNAGCGDALWSENDSSTTAPSVTVQNSSFREFDSYGANVVSGPGGLSSATNIQSTTIGNRSRTANAAGILIFDAASSTVSGSTIDNVSAGIVLQGSPSAAKLNRISNTDQAFVVVSVGNIIQSNSIFNSGAIGIAVIANNNQILSNSIFSAGTGIGLYCSLANSGNVVTGNTINDASTGIANNGIAGNTVAPNNYFNTTTAVGACI